MSLWLNPVRKNSKNVLDVSSVFENISQADSMKEGN